MGGLGYDEDQVIICGRSIGAGPATLLASMFTPRALILLCGYTSIKNVAKKAVGKFLALFVANHFNNLDMIKYVESPTMMIHG